MHSLFIPPHSLAGTFFKRHGDESFEYFESQSEVDRVRGQDVGFDSIYIA